MSDNMTLAVILAIFGSTGFWNFLIAYMQEHRKKKSPRDRLIMGLGHDKICDRCAKYLQRGHITKDEYEDLRKYLYEPYRDMGGNGTCERLMQEVDKLPIKGVAE